jgi:hypothetical protein
MAYKVIPFKADIMAGEGAGKAAAQLQSLLETQGSQGWTFDGLETLQTTVITPSKPGTNGCAGFGAVPGTPESRTNVTVYVAVFHND